MIIGDGETRGVRGFAANLGMLWTDLPLVERVMAAAASGFTGVEVHWPYEIDPHDLRAVVLNSGLELLGLNSWPGRLDRRELGFAAVEGAQPAFRAGIDQALGYCAASGAQAVHVMAGYVAAGQEARARSIFIDNLRWATDRAADIGVTLLIEPLNAIDHPGYFLSEVDQAAALLDEIGRSSVRIQFDSYHVARQGHDVAEVFVRHRDSIGHIQIAACPDRSEPDHGSVDHCAFVRVLVAAGYGGWIAGEYRPRARVEDGLGWLADLHRVLADAGEGVRS